ncbi:MAG: radical SAM protein [Nitrospinota bacterium]
MELKEVVPEFTICVETTRRCSLRCPYCYVVSRPLPKGREVGLGEIGDFIERLLPALEGRDIGVHLTGGEIFTRPGALALIKRLLTLPLLLSVGTNGVYVPEEVFELPAESLELQFSVDGTLPVHSLTREKGERTYRNLKKALEKGFLPTIRTTVHPGNLGAMVDFHRSLDALASS